MITKNWWFKNQYGSSTITIDANNITIKHNTLTTFTLKKQHQIIIPFTTIQTVLVKKPTFWQCGYLYFHLQNETLITNIEQLLLSDLCIALKWKSEYRDAQIIKNMINNLVVNKNSH